VLSQQHISPQTPVGATLQADGATFKVWAPLARAVYLNGIFGGETHHQQTIDRLLEKDARGYWTGFQVGARDGDHYRYWVEGEASHGYKRDPVARELDPAGFPNCFSILRAGEGFPWHDQDFVTPDFADMIIYQLHVGTYAITRPGVASTFLDVALKIPYLAELGVNVLQPLPIDEQECNPTWDMAARICSRPTSPTSRSRTCRPICGRSMRSMPPGASRPLRSPTSSPDPRSSSFWSISAMSTATP
jgi:1,4-alpha-glucan branching enzyme